jgi:hypothetical protein
MAFSCQEASTSTNILVISTAIIQHLRRCDECCCALLLKEYSDRTNNIHPWHSAVLQTVNPNMHFKHYFSSASNRSRTYTMVLNMTHSQT